MCRDCLGTGCFYRTSPSSGPEGGYILKEGICQRCLVRTTLRDMPKKKLFKVRYSNGVLALILAFNIHFAYSKAKRYYWHDVFTVEAHVGL